MSAARLPQSHDAGCSLLAGPQMCRPRRDLPQRLGEQPQEHERQDDRLQREDHDQVDDVLDGVGNAVHKSRHSGAHVERL